MESKRENSENDNNRQSILQQNWQQLHLQDRLHEGATASEKADVLRSLLFQVQCGRAVKCLTPEAGRNLWQQYAERYSQIIDSPAEHAGLDNFAEGALALAAGKRNESQQWKSSLTSESVVQLPCVQKFIKTSKTASQSLIPPGQGHVAILNPLSSKVKDLKSSINDSDTEYKSKTIVSCAATIPTQSRPCANTFENRTDSIQGSVHQIHHGDTSAGQRTHNFSSTGDYSGTKTRPGAGNFFSFGQELQNTSSAANPQRDVLKQITSSKPETLKRIRDSEDKDMEVDNAGLLHFKSAKEQLEINNQKKYSNNRAPPSSSVNSTTYGNTKRSLGTRRGPSSKFIPPVIGREDSDDGGGALVRHGMYPGTSSCSGADQKDEPVDERLKHIDPKMIELITSEIMDHGPPIKWEDIAGLEFAKKTIKEIVVWPMLRPDIFTGLRGPPKGLLLFGPPGTGKTLIGKCIASQSKSTFFSISASSLTSKWVGEAEKMVRALFGVAQVHQPAVIFIDEIDSLLSQRSDGEHEASRRIKTEFLVQLDGATTGQDDRILVVGATNRPQEIDEAARRRFVKRLYIPLPESAARRSIIQHLMQQQCHHLTNEQLDSICDLTDGYSGADMANLCREAALGPIRDMSFGDIENISADQVRQIVFVDFEAALKQVRASVSEKDLDLYIEWNKQYGSWGI